MRGTNDYEERRKIIVTLKYICIYSTSENASEIKTSEKKFSVCSCLSKIEISRSLEAKCPIKVLLSNCVTRVSYF